MLSHRNLSLTSRITIFLLAMIGGAALYLVAAVPRDPHEIPGRGWEENIATEHLPILQPTRFHGELHLVAVANDPVDLSFTKGRTVYLLNRDGTVMEKALSDRDCRKLTLFRDVRTEPFLEEYGCSAIAFHPDFSREETAGFGKFYVALAEEKEGDASTFDDLEKASHQEVIYEMTRQSHLEHREVLRIDVPGGTRSPLITDLSFDRHGHLYIGVSDLIGCRNSRATDISSIYGKVLRVDPLPDAERQSPYRIPESNPFVFLENSYHEIWSYGLRQPHSVSYDPFRDCVCISDTGADSFEELNISNLGAEFFGWNLAEGSFLYPPEELRSAGVEVDLPSVEYARSVRLGKIVGGLIYRGQRFPHLEGKLVFAEESGMLLSASIKRNEPTSRMEVLLSREKTGRPARRMVSGPGGEVFLFGEDGRVFELNKSRPIVESDYRKGAMVACLPGRIPGH